MAFRIGERVCCIKRTPWRDARREEIGPYYRQVLTIREIYSSNAETYLRFEEIRNPQLDYGPRYGVSECGFWSVHFRPVQERKQSTETGMAVLKKILETIPDHRTETAFSTQATEQGAG